MSHEQHRDVFATRMGLPQSARYKHEMSEIIRLANVALRQHPELTWDEALGRALARQDAQVHHREKAKALISSPKNYTRTVHLAIIGLLILICLLLAHKAYGQSTAIRGVAKGTTPANSVTVEAVDGNTNAFPVTIKGGGGSGGGPADTAPNAAASESDVARQKVTTVLRLLDVSLGAGVQLVTAKGTQAGGLWVECKVGCAGGATTPSDAFANPTTAGLQATFNMLYNGATWDRARGDTTNGLWVNCKNGCAGGSSTPSDAFANPTTAGLGMGFQMVWNGTTWDRLKGDTTSGAWVNVKNSSLAVTGTFWQATQPVSGTFWQATQPVSIATMPSTPVTGTFWQATQPVSIAAALDVSDRAARLLGIIYGSQGQQLKQTAVNFNLQVESAVGGTLIDPRSIRALTNADVVKSQLQDNAGNGLTTNSTTYTAKFGLDGNWLGTLGTAFSTPGKVDVKSAAGDLNATLAAETTKVIGTVNVAAAQTIAVTNAGTFATQNSVLAATIAASGAAPPASVLQDGGVTSGATGGLLSANIICDSYAFYDASTSGATQLVALSASRIIYVCGYTFTSSSTTANTLKLVYGTGSNCATGQTAMTPGIILQAATSAGPTGIVVPNGNVKGLKTIASNALCVLTNAAAAAQVQVWYAQF